METTADCKDKHRPGLFPQPKLPFFSLVIISRCSQLVDMEDGGWGHLGKSGKMLQQQPLLNAKQFQARLATHTAMNSLKLSTQSATKRHQKRVVRDENSKLLDC